MGTSGSVRGLAIMTGHCVMSALFFLNCITVLPLSLLYGDILLHPTLLSPPDCHKALRRMGSVGGPFGSSLQNVEADWQLIDHKFDPNVLFAVSIFCSRVGS